MLIPFDNLGQIGSIADIEPENLPNAAWSRLVNIEVGPEGLQKAAGDAQLYYYTMDAGEPSYQSLGGDPWHVRPVRDATDTDYWVYCTDNKVYAARADANRIALTRQTATSTASITTTSSDKDYSATSMSIWSSIVLAGVPIFNVDTAPPQIWSPISESQRLQELDWDKSAGTHWSDRTAGAITCQTLSSFREYAVALYTTENGTAYPRRLRWSHPAPPNTTPYTWDESKVAYDAGLRDFEETDDDLVGFGVLRGTGIVYKKQHTWLMRWVGGRFTFAFDRGFDFGLFAPRCIAALKDRHIILTGSQIVAHDGAGVQPLGAAKWDKTLFQSISPDYWWRTFLWVNDFGGNHEVWICYPSNSSEGWCDRALIYDYEYNTWTERDLVGFADIRTGVVDESTGTTYDGDSGAYDDDSSAYDENVSDPRQTVGVGAQPTTTTYDPYLWRVATGYGLTTLGMSTADVRSTVEREAIPLAAGRSGAPAVDTLQRYLVNAVWPRIKAADGSEVTIQIGTQDTIQEAIQWDSAQTFTVGTDYFTEHLAEGRIVSIRIEAKGQTPWTLMGYSIDVEPAGMY
jgi:hypothetical protein